MNPSDFFAAEELSRAAHIPYAARMYGIGVRELTLREAQEARAKGGWLAVDSGEPNPVCPSCGGTTHRISTGHTVCTKCRPSRSKYRYKGGTNYTCSRCGEHRWHEYGRSVCNKCRKAARKEKADAGK